MIVDVTAYLLPSVLPTLGGECFPCLACLVVFEHFVTARESTWIFHYSFPLSIIKKIYLFILLSSLNNYVLQSKLSSSFVFSAYMPCFFYSF